MAVLHRITDLPPARGGGYTLSNKHQLRLKVERDVQPFSASSNTEVSNQHHLLLSDPDGNVNMNLWASQ
jgi:hypothetical protein